MENKQKKVSVKRIQLVDVVLERKGSQLFEGRRVRSPEDAANIICDFIRDSDHGKFIVLGLSTKNESTVLQVVSSGSINASIVYSRDVMKALILSKTHPACKYRAREKGFALFSGRRVRSLEDVANVVNR